MSNSTNGANLADPSIQNWATNTDTAMPDRDSTDRYVLTRLYRYIPKPVPKRTYNMNTDYRLGNAWL